MYNIMSIIIILFAETSNYLLHLNYNQARGKLSRGKLSRGKSSRGILSRGKLSGVNCPGLNCPPPS